MKVTPPLAVAPITQEDDMRWNPINTRMMTALFPTLKGAARPITTFLLPFHFGRVIKIHRVC